MSTLPGRASPPATPAATCGNIAHTVLQTLPSVLSAVLPQGHTPAGSSTVHAGCACPRLRQMRDCRVRPSLWGFFVGFPRCACVRLLFVFRLQMHNTAHAPHRIHVAHSCAPEWRRPLIAIKQRRAEQAQRDSPGACRRCALSTGLNDPNDITMRRFAGAHCWLRAAPGLRLTRAL